MDELVQLVSQRTGLSEELSRVAVETVLEYLKDRLPQPLAGPIDQLLAGEDIGGLGKGLGGLLG